MDKKDLISISMSILSKEFVHTTVDKWISYHVRRIKDTAYSVLRTPYMICIPQILNKDSVLLYYYLLLLYICVYSEYVHTDNHRKFTNRLHPSTVNAGTDYRDLDPLAYPKAV